MNSKVRRGLLGFFTVAALLFVAVGSLFMDRLFESRPIMFVLFWGACLLCVCLIFVLAVLDLRDVRKQYRKNQQDLDEQMGQIIAEAREAQAKGEEFE